MYEGHHFIKVYGDNWVFDFTEYIGYKVTLDKNKRVKDYKMAFTAIDFKKQIIFEKHIKVPLKVLKETVKIIEKYEREAFISK